MASRRKLQREQEEGLETEENRQEDGGDKHQTHS